MKKIKGKTAEIEELIATDPIAAGRAMLAQFTVESDRAMVKVGRAVGDEETVKALHKAGEAYRRKYSFAHALHEAGVKGCRQTWNFQQRLTEYQQRLWLGIKHGASLPATSEFPASAKKILKAVEAQREVKPPAAVEIEPESGNNYHQRRCENGN